MRRYATANEGGTGLANSVRELAHEAHDVLSRPEFERGDAVDILLKIDRIIDEYGDAGSAPIGKWLENLRRQIEQS